MAMPEPVQQLVPDRLPEGTVVGAWRVLQRRGWGAFGIVYRVERVGDEAAGSFALKLARHPGDLRFAREAELLRRIHHPSVPRLWDCGLWAHPAGDLPFLVMQWVEGVALYDWAHGHTLCSRQVLGWLAQLARALASTHGVDGMHRDVKGDNVLVRFEDSRAMLMDFGAGDFLGAPTLTQEVLPPGTGPYRSPEARRFQARFWRKRGAHYEPSPPDDLYALGVTAYRLVTGIYPAVPFVPPEQLVTVSPELSRLICQLLSMKPSARGTAAQVATAFELAAQAGGPEAELPILPRTSQAPALRRRLPAPPPPARVGRLWLAAAAGFVALLALQAWWALRRGPERQPPPPLAWVEQGEDPEDAGTSLAQEVLMCSARMPQPEPSSEGITLGVPKTPLPGQARPPCKAWEAEIHRSCWRRPEESTPPCKPGDYEWQGFCYYPVLAPAPPSTSREP